jgi:magnesium chelatase family protein
MDALAPTPLLGELNLDGQSRPMRGVLACLLAARAAGLRRAVVPAGLLAEAAVIDARDDGLEGRDEVPSRSTVPRPCRRLWSSSEESGSARARPSVRPVRDICAVSECVAAPL